MKENERLHIWMSGDSSKEGKGIFVGKGAYGFESGGSEMSLLGACKDTQEGGVEMFEGK